MIEHYNVSTKRTVSEMEILIFTKDKITTLFLP